MDDVSNVRSSIRVANLHGVLCTGVYLAAAGTETLASL